MAIDPHNITNFNRSEIELQEFLIFAIMVANKRADLTVEKVEDLLDYEQGRTPFEKLHAMYWTVHVYPGTYEGKKKEPGYMTDKLTARLKEIKSGQYKRIYNALSYLATNLDFCVSTADIEDLEAIPGVGPKTARFFYLHAHEDAKVAALDTHILKFLKDAGYENVPKNTPSVGPRYYDLEAIFIEEALRRDLTPQQFDQMVWSWYANNKQPYPDFFPTNIHGEEVTYAT